MGKLAGQPGMKREWPIIIMACHDKLLAGREPCVYCQAGKCREVNKGGFDIIIVLVLLTTSPKSCPG